MHKVNAGTRSEACVADAPAWDSPDFWKTDPKLTSEAIPWTDPRSPYYTPPASPGSVTVSVSPTANPAEAAWLQSKIDSGADLSTLKPQPTGAAPSKAGLFGPAAGAAGGFFVGGPVGAAIGAAAGWFLTKK